MNDQTTHFGYQQVPVEQKVARVGDVFSSVAEKYDIMNDFMSFGLHRIWKNLAISHLLVRAGHRVLDLAGGTGDLTLKIRPIVGETGEIVLSDINPEMLTVGKNRIINKGHFTNIRYVEANAEQLPFPNNHFDRVIIGFGLRNVTHKEKALKEIYRVLAPGGRLIILEFSTPTLKTLKQFYDQYSFKLIPKIGKWVAQDEASYQYLVESIRMHPDQSTLTNMLLENGFDQASHVNLSSGIVAIHKGDKF